MVDFKKKLNKGEIDKKVNPIDIYTNLDRKSITGPLRPAQDNILNEWFKNKQSEKDLIIKLHTGEGKTLIGLLILQSKLNQNAGPCAFICPNIYLTQQVAQEARKFGIAHCFIGADNELPNDFLEGKKILITHIQKLFNGKSKFGLDNNYVNIGCVILDDSHACITWISQSKSYDELSLNVESLLSDLSFGIEAEKFESAMQELGSLLGFISQRPDKEYRKGPDNLWCGVDNKYFLIECKSEVDESRDEINKHEAGQMNSHCGWFEGEYGMATVKRILIIPTKKLSYYSDFTHKVEIMKKGKLKSLKHAVKSFIKE